MLRLPLSDLEEGRRRLDPAAARYVARVLRQRTGDQLLVFDPEARLEADAQIATTRKAIELTITNLRPAKNVAIRQVTIIQAISKGSKLDVVVRMATELGATRILLADAAHSVKRRTDVERYRRICVEAARQSGRGDLPELLQLSLADAWREGAAALSLFLQPDAKSSLADKLMVARADAVCVAIGPEGGFSRAEKSRAVEFGYQPARLGAFVMRTETASAAALGVVAALS